MTMPGIPTNGPIFKAEFPRNRLAGDTYTTDAIKRFIERVKQGGVYGELGHPVREPWMNGEQWFNRVAMVEVSRACVRFVDAKFDGQILTVWVRAVGNNKEYLEQPEVVLAHRGISRGNDMTVLVTFDIADKDNVNEPIHLSKVLEK